SSRRRHTRCYRDWSSDVCSSDLVTTGKPEACKVSVGLRYPREVVQKRLRNVQLTDRRFAIPPGAAAHKVSATRVLDADAVGVGQIGRASWRERGGVGAATAP